MSSTDDCLLTPIHLKVRDREPWPEGESVFYRLAGNGLYVCRNHQFFRSCVPAPDWPSELAEQKTFLELRYPRVPQRLFELIVGFFAKVGELHGSEAGVLLAWDANAQRIRPIVPEQTATVSRGWSGRNYPIGLHYDIPEVLPAGWTLIGDVHSHVDEAAYTSGTDERDEEHKAGLHIVVGRISREPPDIHIAAVVDRTRFRVSVESVIEKYERRCLKVPARWMEKIKIKAYGSSSNYSSGGYSSTYGSSWNYGDSSGRRSESPRNSSYGYPLRDADGRDDGRNGRHGGSDA